MEFSEDLGKPIKIDEDTAVESDTFAGLADGIKEIERLQDKLIQREKQLSVLEDKLKKKIRITKINIIMKIQQN